MRGYLRYKINKKFFMAFEIEHKYLVINDDYKALSYDSHHIIQGYLSREPERTVRVRIKDDDAFLTVKGKTFGSSRLEFEYQIPKEDGIKMLELCTQPILEKKRYIVPFNGHIWEVDEFMGDKKGLVIAEIELKSEDETYTIPGFVGENVTGDTKYYNSSL